MKYLFIAVFMTSFLAPPYFGRQCKCAAIRRGEVTHPGANHEETFRKEKAYKAVHGIVEDVNGLPLEDVLIEVLDHPEWILLDYSSSLVKQRRIAACKTKENGRFCFRGIPSGKYELRASRDSAWNRSHVYIIINRSDKKAKRTGITVRMTVGD